MFLLAVFAPRLVQNQGIRGWSQWSVVSDQWSGKAKAGTQGLGLVWRLRSSFQELRSRATGPPSALSGLIGPVYSGGSRGRVRFSAAAGRLRGAFLNVASRRCSGYSGWRPSRICWMVRICSFWYCAARRTFPRGLKRLREKGIFGRAKLAGAEARRLFCGLSARLKSCPCYKACRQWSVCAACIAKKYPRRFYPTLDQPSGQRSCAGDPDSRKNKNAVP